MITITRILARQIRSVFRKALRLSGSNPRLRVELIAGPEGLRISSQANGFAAEYYQDGELPVNHVSLPFDLLREIEGAKPEPVTLTMMAEGEAAASWQEGEVPRSTTVSIPEPYPDEPASPNTPDNWLENEPGLRLALQAAMDTSEDTSTRYALATIQLRGSTGAIAATDGRQALLQSGYLFPFDDDVLVPRTMVFGVKDLPADSAVQVGRTEKHVVFRISPWTFFLAIQAEGRFPDVESILPNPADAIATAELNDADCRWLARNIDCLPVNADGIPAITLELNGSVAVRSRSSDSGVPTELVLANSQRHGQEIAFATSRQYLSRALELGFSRLHIYGRDKPVLCQDDRRSLFWATLDAGAVVSAGDNATRVASPIAGQVTRSDVAAGLDSIRRRARSPRVHSARSLPLHEEPVTRPGLRSEATIPTYPSPLEQVQQLRSTLRDVLSAVTVLVRSLKAQRKQDRLVRSTLASFRRLQGVN